MSGGLHPQGVTGKLRWLLRLEGLALLLAALALYARFGVGWRPFAWFFLAPDLAFLGYLAGPRLGAWAYNGTHSSVGPLLLALLAALLPEPALWPAVLIWLAHIGFDRALGYGLKYSAGFGFTHLGPIGKWAKST